MSREIITFGRQVRRDDMGKTQVEVRYPPVIL